MNPKIKFQRYFKRIYFQLKLHWIFPAKFLETLAYLSHESKWITQQKNIPFTSYPFSGFEYQKRFELFEHVIKSENLDRDIKYLEFGVSRGQSFRWWVDRLKNEKATFYGFDTFTGLPEDWGSFKKGEMSNGNKPPQIDNDSRHYFYQGLFQTTLPDFIKENDLSSKKIIHLDADLYSATLYVLTSLAPYLNKGDILFFDEYNVPLHEFKAFKDFRESFYIEYTVLGEVNNFYQTAIRIE